MVNRRGRLAGRGADMLFGSGSGGTSDEESHEGAPSGTDADRAPAGTAPPDDEEALAVQWTAMLEKEAQAAVEQEGIAVSLPDAGESEEPSVQQADLTLPEWATSPEVMEVGEADSLLISESPAVEREQPQAWPDLPPLATTPARPAGPGMAAPAVSADALPAALAAALPTSMPVEPETPPAPMYVEAYMITDEPRAPLPPPKEKPEATDPAVQARLMRVLYAPPEGTWTEGPRGPDEAEAPGPSVMDRTTEEAVRPEATAREREILSYIGLKQRHDLWAETVELYEVASQLLNTDASLPRVMHLLQEAQDILLETPHRFDLAKYKVGQVKSVINKRVNSAKWGKKFGWLAFVYEILWIGVLVYAIWFSPLIVAWFVDGVQGGLGLDAGKLGMLWNTMAWGSVGGALGALYSLYWHIVLRKDFEKQYVMWYLVQPVVGWLLGGLVHLMIGAAFPMPQAEGTPVPQVALSLFPYAIACIVGFRQQSILGMLIPLSVRERSQVFPEAPTDGMMA